MNEKWYVTMTDTFMSGWGMAKDKICKYVYTCDSYEEAEIVAQNAKNRTDQKHVNITKKKPSYPTRSHLTMWKDKTDSPAWYERGYFKK